MPWGDDDYLGINIIRLLYSIFTTVFCSVMYAFGQSPKIYYALVEHHEPEHHSPEPNHILAGLMVVLCITGTITGVIVKIYEVASKQRLEAIIAPQINYSLGIFPIILILLLVLVVYLTDVFEEFTLINLWQTIYVVVSLLYIIAPALVIYRVDQVRSHAVKFLQNKWEDAFYLKIYITPVVITVIMYPSLFIMYQLLDI